MKRWPVRLLAAVCALVVCLGGYWAYWEWQAGGFRPQPRLVRGLAFGRSEISLRLRQRYPIGSDVQRLQGDLAHDAFQVASARQSARAEWGDGVPCRYFVRVDWRADGKGRLASIEGDYENACW